MNNFWQICDPDPGFFSGSGSRSWKNPENPPDTDPDPQPCCRTTHLTSSWTVRLGLGRLDLERKFMSLSYCQELSQWANLAPGWRIKGKRPIRGRLCSLTQLLTITATQKFPSLVAEGEKVVFVDVVQLQNVVVIQQAEIFGHNLLLLQPCENLIESYETFQSIIGVLFFNIFLTEVKTTM